eukprot:gene25553-biopygen15044
MRPSNSRSLPSAFASDAMVDSIASGPVGSGETGESEQITNTWQHLTHYETVPAAMKTCAAPRRTAPHHTTSPRRTGVTRRQACCFPPQPCGVRRGTARRSATPCSAAGRGAAGSSVSTKVFIAGGGKLPGW